MKWFDVRVGKGTALLVVAIAPTLTTTPATAAEVGREPMCVDGADCVEAKPEAPGFRHLRIEFNPSTGVFVDDADAVHMVTGVAARIYVLNRLAFGLEGNTFNRFPLNDVGEDADVRARRLSFGINMAWVAATGRIESSAADFFLLGGGGVVTGESPLTANSSQTRLDFTPYVDLGIGGRLFFNHWFGLTAEARGKAIFDDAVPTAAFEGRLGLTGFFPLYQRLETHAL